MDRFVVSANYVKLCIWSIFLIISERRICILKKHIDQMHRSVIWETQSIIIMYALITAIYSLNYVLGFDVFIIYIHRYNY